METFSRFLFQVQDRSLYRVGNSLQIRMEPGESYSPDKTGHTVLYAVEEDGSNPRLVRFNERGQEVYTRYLRTDKDAIYKLGMSYGFRVRLPGEEHDPILRVAREIGVPVSKVMKDITHTPLGRPEVQVQGLGTVKTERRAFCGATLREMPAGEGLQGGEQMGITNDIGFIVETFERPIKRGTGKFVSQLIVGPKANATIVRNYLEMLGLDHRPDFDLGEELEPVVRRLDNDASNDVHQHHAAA